jgi:hypothetical protein
VVPLEFSLGLIHSIVAMTMTYDRSNVTENVKGLFETMMDHMRNNCENRGIECFSCRLIVRHKDLHIHEKYKCQKRLIACSNSWSGM